MKAIKIISVASAALLMAACAGKKETTYYWGDYQSTLYGYYQQDKSPQQQIDSLNTIVEQAKAKSKPVPPGLHAQLGLLYADTSRPDLAFQQFNTEKTLFPESAAYMDFLMRNKAKK
ncbi:DUF4810 domain-containing protein [Erwinia pyrifoliae]|uniref:DUF4810 domain-containing protein n=1 Tax=Erwinia pyrifoliae TaxID=79967 RepID=A0ABY5X5B9_ERWPY|nr:DUF4810 domain-containing protein [Erwinia pyrifoliae]AUX71904.1 DUF4810 domain-containing protein [Erwinia pyrifoliae]MCA8877859.1 DUF4810 domain-containing protein [Erwinia pyrifoliae]UWS30210.1 DUF4810 domain-containing protein [Erwinia pyrifoliae]UWS32572.1 DUF4810 domain-containing protein [Erwinia pyrifoliae]UXK13222.1 DUF4810 domain-containing protein [Erwinia pyrifoliae]